MIDLKSLKTIAVVGASANPEKYGNKIVKDLLAKDFIVFPINLKEEIIEGQKVYKKLADLPKPVELIDIVLPPEQGINVLREALSLGYKKFWIQPGAESPEIISLLDATPNVDYIANSCIMLR
jgi:hypothetical protein